MSDTEVSVVDHCHFGFPNFLAALLWIELLQKIAYQPISDQAVSWEYAQLNRITSLDPYFERAYSYGSIFLSVFRRDQRGALLLMEKWVKRFPNSWRAHYLLAYHLQHESDRIAEAGAHYLKAALLPNGPSWLSSLALRLMSEEGQLAQTLKLSLEVFPSLVTDESKARVKDTIRSLNYFLQKKLWETSLSSYRKKYGALPKYFAELQLQHGEKTRELASIFPSEVVPELVPTLNERFHFMVNSQGSLDSVPSANELGIKPLGTFHSKQ